MIRLTRGHIQPIGLDIGHDSVRMLQLEVVGQSLAVVAAASQAFGPEAKAAPQLRLPAAVDMIRKMLRGGGFSGRRVVAVLPREIVHVKSIRLPQMPPAELEAAAQFEARNVFAFDIEQAQMHLLPAGEVRQGSDVRQEAILLAVRNEDVDNFVEQLHRAGVVIDSLDAEPCALYRGVERFIRRREDEQEVHVLVDVGLQRSQVVIGHGRDISFYKAIDIGGSRLNAAVARKLDVSPEEAQTLRRRLCQGVELMEAAEGEDPVRQAIIDATRATVGDLAREVSLCLRYYYVTFRGQRPSRVRLLGGEAHDPQIEKAMSSALGITVEAGRPLYNVDVGRMKPIDRRGAMSEWGLALGLGLKRTEGRFTPRDGTSRSRQEQAAQAAARESEAVAGGLPGTAGAEAAGAQGDRRSDSRAAPQEVAHA